MNDMIEDVELENDEDAQASAVDKLEIGQLRKYAKFMGIQSERTWTKTEFIKAIQERQKSQTVGIVFDNGSAPKPGYSRVIIHRDPTPGHKNTPVHAGYNGALFAIPRGLEVDVPTPLVGSLANAKSIQVKSGDAISDGEGTGHTRDQEQLSYPFQVLAVTPGSAVNQHDNRANSYKDRKAFVDAFGRWPTHAELAEAIKAKLIRAANAIT